MKNSVKRKFYQHSDVSNSMTGNRANMHDSAITSGNRKRNLSVNCSSGVPSPIKGRSTQPSDREQRLEEDPIGPLPNTTTTTPSRFPPFSGRWRETTDIPWVWSSEVPVATSRASDVLGAVRTGGNESGLPCRGTGAVQVINLTAEKELCHILPTVVVTKSLIFIYGARVRPDHISEKIGQDLESELTPLPDMQEPEWIENVTENGIISIKYPFRPHNCAACWERPYGKQS